MKTNMNMFFIDFRKGEYDSIGHSVNLEEVLDLAIRISFEKNLPLYIMIENKKDKHIPYLKIYGSTVKYVYKF